jgi:hypothetical protein
MDSEDTAIDYESESDTGTPERRSGFKWLLRIFVGGVLALALLVLALPMIVAMFGLQNILLGRATVEQDVSASAGSASLGWFTPITLSHMKVERDDGTLTVDAASFSTERSLLDLLLGLPDVGTITLDRPSVVLRPAEKHLKAMTDTEAASRKTLPRN